MLAGVVAIGKLFPRHRGFNTAIKKILQREQEDPASIGSEMIDDFRLRGHARAVIWVDHLQKGSGARRWRTRWRVPSTTPTLHSQRARPRCCGPGCARESALHRGWHGFPESSAVKRSAVPAACVPASHSASWRHTGGGGSGGSDPPIFGAGAPPGRGRWCTPKSTTSPPLVGVAPSTVIPGGKAEMRKTCTRVVLLNPALRAVGLALALAGVSLLRGFGIFPRPWGQVTRPVVHQDTPALEQVRAGIGCLDPVPDDMRQGCLDHLPGMVGQPVSSVNVFTGLYLFRIERLMIPP